MKIKGGHKDHLFFFFIINCLIPFFNIYLFIYICYYLHMKKKNKILLIISLVLSMISLLGFIFSLWLSISFFIDYNKLISGMDEASISMAFALVFYIIFGGITCGVSILSNSLLVFIKPKTKKEKILLILNTIIVIILLVLFIVMYLLSQR